MEHALTVEDSNRPLSEREQAYASHRAAGLSQREALSAAGYKGGAGEAYRLDHRPHVAQEIQRLREAAQAHKAKAVDPVALAELHASIGAPASKQGLAHAKRVLSLLEAQGLLSEVAQDPDAKDRVKAIDILLKSLGAYAKADEANAVQKVLDRLRDGLPRDVFVQCLRVLAQADMPKPADIDV